MVAELEDRSNDKGPSKFQIDTKRGGEGVKFSDPQYVQGGWSGCRTGNGE